MQISASINKQGKKNADAFKHIIKGISKDKYRGFKIVGTKVHVFLIKNGIYIY
jgi:hypothetical protein